MKGLKKNSVRTRKRVIAILLSVLMVLSIVIPSGGSGVRYNAFAEGEESAVGEGVDLNSEEGTDEEEVTSEEMMEETMEETSDISSEATTETDENLGIDEVSPVTTEQAEEDELFEDENLLLGSGNTSDDELFEDESLLGEGEYSAVLVDITSYVEANIKSQPSSRSDNFTVDITYTIPSDKYSQAYVENVDKVIWTYDLNTWLSQNEDLKNIIDKSTGNIVEGQTTRGTYKIEGNIVYLYVNMDWLKSVVNPEAGTTQQDAIRGTFSMDISLDAEHIGSKDSITFSFPGQAAGATNSLSFPTASNVETTKSVTGASGNNVTVSENGNGTYNVDYTISVKENSYENDSLKVIDTLSNSNQSFEKTSFVVKFYDAKDNNQEKTITINDGNITFSNEDKTATVDLYNALKANGYNVVSDTEYKISYSTTIPASELGSELTNSVNATWGTDKSSTPKDTKITPVTNIYVNKSYEAVSGETDTYKYKIVIGDGTYDLSNLEITDTMKDLQSLIGDVTLNSVPIDVSGESTFKDNVFSETNYTLFTYNTGASFGKGPITIEYTVKIPESSEVPAISGTKNINNDVLVTGTGKRGSDNTSFNHNFESVGSGTVNKEFDSFDVENNKIKWKIEVSNTGENVLTNAYISETPSSNSLANVHWFNQYLAAVDWDNVNVTETNGTPISSDNYIIDSTNNKLTLKSIPANTTYYIYLFTKPIGDNGTELIEGVTYQNSVFLMNEYNVKLDEATVQKKYSSNKYGVNKSYTYDENTKEFIWTVVVNPSKVEIDPDYELYFVDDIPDGMEFVDGSLSVSCSGKTNGNEYWNENYGSNTISASDNKLGPVSVSSIVNENVYGGGRIIGISGLATTITYKTKLTASEINNVKGTTTTHSYTNEFKVTDSTGNTIYAKDSETATYDYKFLTKKDLSDADLGDEDYIDFSIDVNPDSLELNHGSRLTLKDHLATAIELMTDKTGSHAFTIKDEAGKDLLASGDATLSYNDDDRDITITIPDGMHVIVRYTVRARGLGNITVNNTARLELTGTSDVYEDSTNDSHKVAHHSATIGAGNLKLHKIDENDIFTELSDAKFDIYKLTLDSNKVITGEKRILTNVTGASGYYSLSSDEFSEGNVYYWEEVSPPAGYELNSTKHYFVFYQEDDTITNLNDNPSYTSADALDEATSQANSIIIAKIPFSYTWTVCNTKSSSVGTINATKKFISTNGKSDTFYFSLYSVDGANETLYATNPIKNTGSLIGTSEGTEASVSWSNIPYGTYKVYETDENGNKITSSDKYIIDNTEGLSVELNAASKNAGTITNTEKICDIAVVKKVVFSTGSEAVNNYTDTPFYVSVSLDDTSINGTYSFTRTKSDSSTEQGSVKFVNGISETNIMIKANERIVIHDLPVNTMVSVTETDAAKTVYTNYTYDTSSGTSINSASEKTVYGSTPDIVIKNQYTQDKGNLTITKKKASGSENFPAGKTFPVSVLFKSAVNVSVNVGSGTAGDNSFSANTAQIFDIAENESIEITGIPAGTEYEISEVLNDTDYLGFAVPEIKYGNSSKTISKDKTDTVEVLNKYTEVTGSLTIHKSTSGRNWADVKDYISFTVTGPNSYSNTIEGNAIGWTGTGNDVTYTLSGLELGTYTVTENISDSTDTEKDYYTLVTKAAAAFNPTAEASSISDIELASSAKDKDAYFVNSYTRKTGGFTVTKELTGTNADSSKTFPIVIKLTYPSVGDISGSYTVAGGASQSISGSNKVVELTVNLAKDKSAVFTGIPYGTTFEVSETISDADAAAGYTKTSIVPNESKTMDDTTKDTTVTVTNNYNQGKGSIVIYKTLSGDNNINWDNVKGDISFKISNGTAADDKTVLGTEDGWEYNETTKVATYTYTDLELGTYSVTEVLNTSTGTVATNYDVTTKAGAAENPTTTGDEVSDIELSTSNRSGKAYFTNEYTRKTGSFTVEKKGTFEGDATEFETDKEFRITVSFTFPSGVTPAGSYKIGSGSSTAINGNSVTFNLKKDEKATFTGIPYGTTYTVSEADLSDELLNYGYLKDSIVYGNDTSLNKGTITDTISNTNVVVHNKRVLPVKGYIEITKTVSGDRGWNDIKDYISFSITSDGVTKTIRGTDPKWSVTGNVAKYQLTELDLDKTYKVEEIINGDTKASYYRLTQTAGKTDTELATGKEVSDIALSSTSKSGKAYFENNYTRLTGSLELVKAFDTSVTDYPADYEDEMFTVTVTLKDENNNALTGNVTYDGVTFSNGSAEVQISANQSKTISGIPYGYSFSVTENQPTAAGYRILTGHGTASGTIDADKPAPIAKVTNTYSPTTGSLRIIKSFGANSALTAGDITSGQITFDVSGTSATSYHQIFDYTNFTNSQLTISSLEPDTYTIIERSTISNSDYTKTTTVKVGSGVDNVSDSIDAQVSAGAMAEVTFTNTYTRVENAKLKITKKVTGLPDSIKADKEFKLVIEYREDGSTPTKYVAKDTSSTSGYSIVTTEPTGDAVPNVKAGTPLVITNLPYGTYNVKEKTDSASIDVDYYTFKLSDSTVTGEQVLDSNVQKEVALTNTYEENRTVGFNKFDLTSGTALPLDGASFELYKGADLISRVVPSNGAFYVNGLKANVTYTLREVSAPDGYTTVKDITFVIDENNKVTVTPGKVGEATATGDIINVYDKKTSVKISKVDITNEKELPGATIQILDKDGNVVTDENGDKLEWISTSTPKEIVGLKTGVTYTLRETVAPDGYQLTTDTVFKLNKDGSLDGTATTTTVSNEGVLLVEDAPLGAFAVNKKGYYNELCSDGANATIPLEGVKFTLTKKDDAAFGQTKETDKDGIAAFTGLQPGTYELKETQTIEGYILDESVYTIKINADGSNDGLKDASGKAVEGNIITNDVPRTNLQLVKVNLSNKNVKLPGSTYGLFRKSLGIGTDTGKGTNEDGQLVKIAESVTDKDGILSFKGVLTGVDYTVQELAAPNGFYVSEQPITISFKTDEKGNVVIDKVSDGKGTIVLSATGEITWLEPQIKVSFTKQDMNGKNLAGAKLKVVDSNGNDVISWTSTTEAYVVEGTFTSGESYKLVEVEAPEGYEIAEPVEFTIAEKAGANGADVISVIMKDKEKTTTTVTPPEKTTPPSVKTGDSAPVKPLTAMMFISLAGIVFLLILGRRRKELFK